MTEQRKRIGRPSIYGLTPMAVGDSVAMPAPTGADVKRIARNVSQYGQRNNRYYRCKTDITTRIMTITRIR